MHFRKLLHQEYPAFGLRDTCGNVFLRVDIVPHHDEKAVVQKGAGRPERACGAVEFLLFNVLYPLVPVSLTEMFPDDLAPISDDEYRLVYFFRQSVKLVLRSGLPPTGSIGLGTSPVSSTMRAAPRRQNDCLHKKALSMRAAPCGALSNQCKMAYERLCTISPRMRSIVRAAASLPPKPNAKPNASESATTSPVKSVCTNSVATPS